MGAAGRPGRGVGLTGRAAACAILAAALWASGNRWARRAAWRGLGSMAAAGTVASLADRRPARPGVAAASAAAFATGIALELPYVGVPALAIGAGPAISRAMAQADHPPDVLAGAALGVAAGLFSLRWWPRRPRRAAAAARPPWRAPATAAGEGLALLINMSAGTASAGLARWLAAELPAATITELTAGQDLAAALRRAAAQARILGVAGGDGSVSTAAAVAVHLGLPLLVIPAGTFNHFAADLGIWSAHDAVAALRAGDAVLVDVAVAGARSFVNTSSTGVYVDLVRARQQLEGRLGRRLAAVVGLIQVLCRSTPHELVLNGQRRRLWLYFAGNCRYEPPGMAPAYRPDLCDGCLDIRVVEAGLLARSRLVAAVLTGTLGRSRVYHSWLADSAEIQAVDGAPVWLSVDGEVATAESGFTQGKHHRGLLVYRRAGPEPGREVPT